MPKKIKLLPQIELGFTLLVKRWHQSSVEQNAKLSTQFEMFKNVFCHLLASLAFSMCEYVVYAGNICDINVLL